MGGEMRSDVGGVDIAWEVAENGRKMLRMAGGEMHTVAMIR